MLKIITSESSRALNAFRCVSDVAKGHRALGENADLDAITEWVIAVGGVGIWFMPGDLIGLRAPVGFPPVEALKDLRIAVRACAQIDMRSFEALGAALRDLVDFAQD